MRPVSSSSARRTLTPLGSVTCLATEIVTVRLLAQGAVEKLSVEMITGAIGAGTVGRTGTTAGGVAGGAPWRDDRAVAAVG